jgi:hypothetical protein
MSSLKGSEEKGREGNRRREGRKGGREEKETEERGKSSKKRREGKGKRRSDDKTRIGALR